MHACRAVRAHARDHAQLNKNLVRLRSAQRQTDSQRDGQRAGIIFSEDGKMYHIARVCGLKTVYIFTQQL